MRQLESEIRRCSVAASDMTEGLRLEEGLRRCVEPAWLRPTRCDTGVGCKRPCNSRASAQGRFGSKIGSDRDTRESTIVASLRAMRNEGCAQGTVLIRG